MVIERPECLRALKKARGSGNIKLVTGMRGAGKSFLCLELYRRYLLGEYIGAERIIEVRLKEDAFSSLRGAAELDGFIRGRLPKGGGFVFIDDAQLVCGDGGLDILSLAEGLAALGDVELYLITPDRALLTRGAASGRVGVDEIRVRPLSYPEFIRAFANARDGFRQYARFGGLPGVLCHRDEEEKLEALQRTADDILSDVSRRLPEYAGELLRALAGTLGSLQDTAGILAKLRAAGFTSVTARELEGTLRGLSDMCLLHSAEAFDVRTGRASGRSRRFYLEDTGLWRALCEGEPSDGQAMANILYRALSDMGFSVSTGAVDCSVKDSDGGRRRARLEIDFIAANDQGIRAIQLVDRAGGDGERERKLKPLLKTPESFRRMFVINDGIATWRDYYGVLNVSLHNASRDRSVYDKTRKSAWDELMEGI